MLENVLYTALGASRMVRKNIKKELKSFEEKGLLKKDDVKSFIKKLEENGKVEDKKLKKEMKSMIKEIIDDLGIATKEDLSKLKDELKSSNN